MFTKAKFVLAAALVLGTVSAALAGGLDNWNDAGGYVVRGSMAGVGPIYQPRWFPNYARTGRDYAFARLVTYKHRSRRYRDEGAADLSTGAVIRRALAASPPWSGCDHEYTYDRANYGASYDLVCEGINVSPH